MNQVFPLVIKIGGDVIEQKAYSTGLLAALQQLQQQTPVVLVHGGGSAVQDLLAKLGLPSVKKDGLRVTPLEQIGYVTGVLAGTANKSLCAQASALGIRSVGLSLCDGGMTECKVLDEALGAVGSAKPGDPGLLTTLLSTDYLPIISSIGVDPHGQLLNVNADQAAIAIAQLLGANLLLLSDVPGVLNADKALIAELHADEIDALVNDGVIRDGMTVKVRAAQEAAQALGRPVTIASWKQPEQISHCASHQIGTRIHPEKSIQEHP